MALRVSRKRCVSAFLAIAMVGATTAPSSSGSIQAKPQTEVAVLHRAKQSHRLAATTICQALQDAGRGCVLIELLAESDDPGRERTIKKLIDTRPAVVATGGTKATIFALENLPDTPVVFFLVPNAEDAPFVAPDSPDKRRVAGVTTDISPDEQIRWLSRISSSVRRVGVLTSPRSRRTTSKLKEAGRKYSVTIVPVETDKDDFMSAIETLNTRGVDAVLMIPDARVYNSLTVQRLLVWGIRQKKLISAFSSHVVKAGALTGQYCETEAIGWQTARLIQDVMGGADISIIGVRHPEHVSRGLNERTAEMIGVVIERELATQVTEHYGSER